MLTPQLTQQHRKLELLAGQWEGKETVLPSSWNPKGGSAKCFVDAHLEVDGFFLVIDYIHEEAEAALKFRAHGVVGWDNEKSAYFMHWFDAYGAWVGSGKWNDSKLAFEFPNHRVSYELKEKSYIFRIEIRQAAGLQLSQEGTYRRRGPNGLLLDGRVHA
jgi:hypothetical protein